MNTDGGTRASLAIRRKCGYALKNYDSACRAIAAARRIDEARAIRSKAEALRVYARQAKNRQLEIDAAEIRIRAERRVGELIQNQRASVGLAVGGRPYQSTRFSGNPVRKPTLAEVGVDKRLAHRARKLAEMPSDVFEDHLSRWRDDAQADGRVTTTFRQNGTGNDEWYTPAEYIEAAREAMGGIDFDPASIAVAQRTVRAKVFCSIDDDGLSKRWRGRVWLNPPYSQPTLDSFIDKLFTEIQSGRVSQAILLTHSFTDTTWFHKAESRAALLCFTRGRIRFVSCQGEVRNPPLGQTLFYYGQHGARFRKAFRPFGFIR